MSGHRPIYNSKHHDASGNPTLDALYLQQAIENLLYKYNVDIYFSGASGPV